MYCTEIGRRVLGCGCGCDELICSRRGACVCWLSLLSVCRYLGRKERTDRYNLLDAFFFFLYIYIYVL